MKKMVIITPWYNCFSGGAEVLARQLAEQSTNRGINVEVLTTTVTSPYDSWWLDGKRSGHQTVNDVLVKRFSVNQYGKKEYQAAVTKQIQKHPLNDEDKENFFSFGISSDQLIEYVSGLDEDTLILTLPYFQALTHNVIRKNPNKISFIPCFHNEPQFFWTPTRNMIADCKNIFFLSQPEKEMTIHQYGLEFGKKVIEAPVIGAGVEISDDKKTVKGLPEKYIVYVGRKDAGKGVKELVQFHTNLPLDLPLVFVGGGDENLIPKNEKFIDFGFVEEAEKNFIIQQSTCLVNFSPNESFSFVIMEAWLHQIPVIVNAQCNVTKYHVEQSQGGFSVKNANEYQAAINFLLENPIQAKQLGKNGNDYVLSKYRWDIVIGKLLSGEAK